MDQDIVYIPSRQSTVPITGQVLKPGYYEVTNKEKLRDLINFAGGKSSNASISTFVFKNNNKAFLLDDKELNNFFINDGDSIHIPANPRTTKNRIGITK